MRTRISPALVVACLALAVALGGVSYAAVSLPKNSVGTKQLKRNAVNGVKVQNKSLGRLDINQASLGFGKSVSIAAADMYGTDASASSPRTRRMAISPSSFSCRRARASPRSRPTCSTTRRATSRRI